MPRRRTRKAGPTLEVRLTFASARIAATVASAVRPDDPDYVEVRQRGRNVVLKCGGDDLASVLATADDLLACIGAAQRIAAGPSRGR